MCLDGYVRRFLDENIFIVRSSSCMGALEASGKEAGERETCKDHLEIPLYRGDGNPDYLLRT